MHWYWSEHILRGEYVIHIMYVLSCNMLTVRKRREIGAPMWTCWRKGENRTKNRPIEKKFGPKNAVGCSKGIEYIS